MTSNFIAITRRQIEAEDEAAVFEIFAATQGGKFQQAGLPSTLIAQLLQQQYCAQQAQYRQQYPEAHYELIFLGEVPVGYLYTDCSGQGMRLIDIALLPASRGQGIGSQVVSDLIRQANVSGKRIDAHVAIGNPAWDLWQRLGFECVADDGVHRTIVRQPD